MISIDAILLGGGAGKRFSERQIESNSGLPKQFQMLGAAPVFIHALRSLFKLNCIRQVVFVVPFEWVDTAEQQLHTFLPSAQSVVRIIVGGKRRQDSSRLGLEALEVGIPAPARVLIHDACRPFLSASFLTRIKESLMNRSYGAWIPVVTATDTLKVIENSQVKETLDRSAIFQVQTPQIFEYSVIRSLIEKTKELNKLNFTDDASLCEYYGIPVGTFVGDVRNLKLTYDFETLTLKSLCAESMEASCDQELDTTFTV